MDLRERLQSLLGGTYTLDRELGGGAMSRVFLATEVELGRRVVIKVLPPETAAQVSTERFKREIALAAQLQQPHIVPLLSAAEVDGLAYYTMPFIEGDSLRARLTREGELPIGDTVSVLKDVARALSYAHGRGVVHRDIKPDNVLVSGGSAMVTDFGVAKALTASTNDAESGSISTLGIALGTPAYMTPEQASADPLIDHRADIYSFGVLAYELLTGQPPFAGRSTQAVLAAHVSESPAPVDRRRPGTPPELAALVMRCLAKRPADRPQNAADVLQALEEVGTPRAGVPAGAASGLRARGVAIGIGAVLGLAALALAFTLWRAQPVATEPAKSIAVVPFTNLGGSIDDDPFAEGMTVEITDALGRIAGLNVKAASLTKAAARSGVDVLHIGRTLGVSALLTGSFQRLGNRIRINTQLINVADGFQQWTGKYDVDFKDVFAVQDTIARAIANGLRVRLTGQQQVQLVRAATPSTEAYKLYLQGIYLWNRRTYGNINQAIRYFEQAIAKDPKYAQAYAGVGMAYAVLPTYGDIDNGQAFANAEKLSLQALAIDSTSVEAHAALGFSYMGTYRNASAERELRRSIELDSTFATAHQWLAIVLTRSRQFDEAIRSAERARDLDPQSRVIQSSLGQTLLQARRFAEAERVMGALIAFDSTYANVYRNLAFTLMAEGRTAEAVATARRYFSESGYRWSWETAALGIAYLADGQTREARTILDELLDRAKRERVSAAGIALLYDGLGAREPALQWLERAIERYEPLYNWAHGPIFDHLRADPRAAALLARVEGPGS
jgi:TolB-like protein/Tfp pilus assembly protein PilF/tRNA A-37 threonylcarbamoyl transferase component Bud32